MKIGQRIAELRDQRGWTQERLAERAGIARGTLAAIEVGHRKPSRWVLRDIAKALRVEVEDLTEGGRQ